MVEWVDLTHVERELDSEFAILTVIREIVEKNIKIRKVEQVDD